MTFTYHTANKKLNTARNECAGKPVANNTRLYRRVIDSGTISARPAIALRLHNTDVVTFLPNETMILNSGGWRSVTTLARIRDYADTRVHTDAGSWYVPTQKARAYVLLSSYRYGWLNDATGYRTSGPAVRKGLEMGLLVPFADGIRVDSDGFAL